MAYSLDGDLYFQDGSRPPLQLTHSREYRHPIGFSEDGEKILFEGDSGILYSIQVDGNNEKPLVDAQLLPTTPEGDTQPTAFCEPILVPHSPLILFRTCTHPQEATTIYQDDLYIVDTDANKAKLLFQRGYGGSHRIPSPDGKKLAIDHIGYIDIIHIDGRMIKHKLATYTVSEPWALAALVFWMADSSELVVAQPINTFYDSSPPPTFEIWKYSLDTGAERKINLDSYPSGIDPVKVSPDGNWLLYNNFDDLPFYLVNLQDGHSQEYDSGGWMQPGEWSPDSVHFVYTGLSGLVSIGSVYGPPEYLGKGRFVGWLDAVRFIYFESGSGYMIKEIDGDKTPVLTGNVGQLLSYNNIVFYLPGIK